MDKFINCRRELFLFSALFGGLKGGSVSHLKTILKTTNANPNEIVPRLGVAPLHLAIGNESENFAEEVTRLFLQYGGNPNVRSADGQTPVHIAAAWGRVNILKLLLINGGDPWLCDDDNYTAFHLAFRGRHWKIVKLLKTFCLEDLEQEDDCQQKYIITLDKVHLYNKNIAIQYELSPQDAPSLNCTRSVATQTFKNSPKTSLDDSDFHVVEKPAVKKQMINNQIAHTSEIPIAENNLQLEISEINVDDENLYVKKHKNTNVQSKLNTKRSHEISNEHCILSNRSLKDQLLQELKKFHNEKNKKCLHTDENAVGNVTLVKSSENAEKNEKFDKMDSNTKCGNTELVNKAGNDVNALSEKNMRHKENSPEILTKNKIECINLHNLRILQVKDNRMGTDSVSDTKETEIVHSGNKFLDCDFQKIDITDDLPLEEEWTASHSCFMLLDESDYTTLVSNTDDIQTIRLPQECKQNFKHYATHKIQQNSLTSTSSSGESFVSVTEEYKYSDLEEGVVLLEKIFLIPSVSISCLQSKQIKTSEDSSNDNAVDQSATSDSSIPSSLDYDTDVLRNKLKERGFVPGPIVPSTKKLYLRKLMRLEKNPMRISVDSKVYSPELQRTLQGFNWSRRLAEYLKLEKEIVEQFAQPEPGQRWREGNLKSSFTYLLLDPRITENLPCRVETLDKLQVWSLFLSAIFYVGKGKRSRPYSHLYQAFATWKSKTMDTDDKKVQYILDIWKAGMGFVCLHIYQNVISVEAYTREAAMIDALGLRNLKNACCGEYYGIASTWTLHQKRKLGTFLLYRAMLIFLQEGERQLRPGDIA